MCIHFRWCCALCVAAYVASMFVAPIRLQADVDQWKFTNKTGQDAKDLHLKWEGNVSWPGTGVPPQQPPNTFAAVNGNGTNAVGLAQAQTGGGVPHQHPPASVVMDFHYTGEKPVLLEAWWTFTNSTTEMQLPGFPDPVRLQTVPGKINEWAMTPATGDGVLAVTIDHTQSLFQTITGEDGIATAGRFGKFIESLPFGDVISLNANQISYTGLSYSDDLPNIMVHVLQQDSTQPLSVSTIPEPATMAPLLGAGTLLVRRWRRARSGTCRSC